MFSADQRYVSIAINDATIKVAQGTSSGVVEKIARACAVDTSSVEETANTLKSLLFTFDRKASVVCVIPANAATTKNIEVPSTDPEEIKAIIHLQVSRYTPYSREEVLIHYIHLGMSASNNTRVLLVIAHRDMIKERTAVLIKAGLSPDKILFVPEVIARFYIKALDLKKEAPAYGIIDFALNSTNYIIIANGAMVFARPIPVGIKAMMEGAKAPPKLLEELNKSISAFVGEDGSEPVASYVVTTEHEAVRNILPVLNKELKVEFQLNPFTNFIKGSGAIQRELQNEFADDSFLDVIAPIFVVAKSEIDLMPQEMILKKMVAHQSREAFKAVAAVVFLMVLGGSMILSNIYFKDTFLNKNLRERFTSQRLQVKTLKDRIGKTKVIHDYLKNRMASLEVINELYTITPQVIYLNTLSMEEDGSVTIEGFSDSMSQVFSYVKALDDSLLFKGAKTKSTSTKRERGRDVAAFEIVFKLKE